MLYIIYMDCLRLKELRNKSGLTQVKFAEKFGISYGTIAMWETGKREPDNDTVIRLAKFFNVTTDYLLGRSDYPYPRPSNEIPVGDFVKLPVVGAIRAGFDGILLEEYTGEEVEVPKGILNKYECSELFALHVKGNSMYPKIEEGDIILAHKVASVDSGTIAVIMYNGDEATVKKVHYKQGEDWLELIPINPEYTTKRIEGAELEQCHILGKVIYQFRKF